MVLEARIMNSAAVEAEENSKSDEQKLDEQQVIEMCLEIYFAKHAKESSAQNFRLFSRYDFEIWMQSNIKDLINFIYPDVDQELVKRKITRWLSQNLPPKI